MSRRKTKTGDEVNSAPRRRGDRGPTAVWIEARKGPNGTSYRVRWVDPTTGQVKSKACGRDKALARDRRNAKRLELREGLTGKTPNKTLSELKEAINAFMVGKSPVTVRHTTGSLTRLIELCGNRRLEHVDRAFIMDFRASLADSKNSPATINKHTRQIKSALSYAVDAGWLRTNPLWRWKSMQLREPEKRIRVVEADEFAKLVEIATNPTFKVLLKVAYYQGLRRTELANLRWTAVDLDRGLLHVENVAEAGELTKSRKNRTLPMNPVVQTELATMLANAPRVVEDGEARLKSPHVFSWPDGTKYRPDWITVEFRRVVKKAKIERCSIHDLRRSFSTLAQRAGVDKATVKDLGGWSTIGVVEKHYTGEVPQVFERAMEKIRAAQGVA